MTKGPGLITQLETWLEADPAKYAANKTLIDSLVEGSHTNLFDKTLELFKKPINNCNKLCVDFVLSHVKSNLQGVHLSEEWVVEEGAVFSPSPLSYITNLGDYLLLLPQQLEPFFAEENIPLDTALRLVDFTQFPGMAQGKICFKATELAHKYTKSAPCYRLNLFWPCFFTTCYSYVTVRSL